MHINVERAIALLRGAVALKGADHVQDECRYAPIAPDQDFVREPGCIVGTALFLGGVPLDTLESCEGVFGVDVAYARAIPKFNHAGITFSPAAARLFSIAQSLQDGRPHDLPHDLPASYLTAVQDAPRKLQWGRAMEDAIAYA